MARHRYYDEDEDFRYGLRYQEDLQENEKEDSLASAASAVRFSAVWCLCVCRG